LDLDRQAVRQLLDVSYYSHESTRIAELLDRRHDDLEGLGIEGPKPFI
jgi:hypothetical protein